VANLENLGALLSIIVLTKENINRIRKNEKYAKLPESELWEQLKKRVAQWVLRREVK